MVSISPNGTQGYVLWDGRVAYELIDLHTVTKSNIIKLVPPYPLQEKCYVS